MVKFEGFCCFFESEVFGLGVFINCFGSHLLGLVFATFKITEYTIDVRIVPH